MLVVGHDHGNMAVGSIVLSVVPIGKLIGTRKSEFAGSPPLAMEHGRSLLLPWSLLHSREILLLFLFFIFIYLVHVRRMYT